MSVARITAFNNLLRDIVQVVSERFPDDKELEYTKSQIELSVSVSPRKTIISFIKSTQPYLEKILHKDEAFFLELADKTTSLQPLSIGEKWLALDAAQREKLWKNVQKMVVLGNKIMTE